MNTEIKEMVDLQKMFGITVGVVVPYSNLISAIAIIAFAIFVGNNRRPASGL